MAPGENPAPFIVTGNVAGNRGGTIRMWQSRLSFAVGFLLSAGSSVAVAETENQAGQAPPLPALSVAEFARLVNDEASVSTADTPVQVVQNPPPAQADSAVRQSGERRVLSLSLVEFVEKAAAEGTAGEVPRVSLVDLVASETGQEATETDPVAPPRGDSGAAESRRGAAPTKGATNTSRPAGAPPRGDAGPKASPRSAGTESAGGPSGVLRTPSARGAPPTIVAGSTQLAAEQVESVERTEAVEPLVARSLTEPLPADSDPVGAPPRGDAGRKASPRSASTEPAATPSDTLRLPSPDGMATAVPPASLAQYSAGSADPASLPLPLSIPSATSLTPDGSGKLQLFDAVRSALNEHPAIVESLSRLDAQQEQVSVARAGYWPQLRTGINSGYRHTTGRSEEALSVSASQMLYDFGKVSSAVDAATRGVDREQASVLLAAEDLIRETSKAFIEARRYEVLLELAGEHIDAIAELEALAAKRSTLGAATASDQMQAKSRRESARATQLQMQAQRDQWHRALENLIGSQQPLTLDDSWPEPLEGLCPRLPENFDSAPRIVLAEAERAEAEAAIRQARAEQRPTLSLNADFEHYLNRANEGLQRLDDQEFVVSLNLTSNLFQGGALRARSRAAEHALYSATAARDRALLELSRLYRETRDRSLSLTSSLALQDERHDSIVKTQKLYRHQYLSLGTRTLLDILNTEQEIFQTQVDKQNTLFDLRSLQIDCLYSVGGLRESFRASDALNNRVSTSRTEGRS